MELKKASRRKDNLTPEEIKKMFQDLKGNAEAKGLLATLLLTGCRISEALLLKFKDIYTDENWIYFRMVVLKYRNNKKPIILKKIPKSNPLVPFILYYYNNTDNPRIANNIIFEKSRQSYSKIFKKINPLFNPHLCRKYLATKLSEKIDVYDLRDWFHWSSIRHSEPYVLRKPSINRVANLYNKVDLI